MELQISEMNGDSDPFNISFNDNIWSQFNTEKEEEKPEEDDDLQEQFGCANCKTYTLMYKDGHHICTNCGVVQQKRLTMKLNIGFMEIVIIKVQTQSV